MNAAGRKLTLRQETFRGLTYQAEQVSLEVSNSALAHVAAERRRKA
ncbi:hypothetical protein BSU04_00320 [Caballeronia sordidicola]|uniref:Uncharacterized protein n=1 Tax=Caballeronia sordidicola TaxID=196367 RepID=A0A226XC47_CABSO|nr:hypothetical protein BSU04_00320 [Caballeronia sordidicola]